MAVLVDDASVPVDNSLSSPALEGAAEFRALKAKINSLYLNSGVGATYSYLVDTANRGLNVNIIDNSAADNYGSKFKMQRTANAATKSSYGVWAEGILANSISITTGTIAGLASVTTVGTGCTVGFIYALNSVIYQQTHNILSTITGFYVLFSNRFSAGTAAPGGLGSNQYNNISTALLIDSFPRSSSGEFCGWVDGIRFTADSIDRCSTRLGYGIDMSAVKTMSGAVTLDPLTSYRFKGAIRLSHMMPIIWEVGDSITTYYDGNTGRFTFRNGATKRFEIDMATGAIYRSGVLVP